MEEGGLAADYNERSVGRTLNETTVGFRAYAVSTELDLSFCNR